MNNITCDNCGKEFYLKPSRIRRNKHNYCCVACKNYHKGWHKDELFILEYSYGEIPLGDISYLLNYRWSESKIREQAKRVGIAKRKYTKFWTQEDINILMDNYPKYGLDYVCKLLPNKTRGSISNKVTNLKLTRDKCVNPMTPISNYIRDRLKVWRNKVMMNNNWECEITSRGGNLAVHHIRSFDSILKEAMLGIDINPNSFTGDYSDKELDDLYSEFMRIQERDKLYICILQDIHKQFHSLYGYGNNTKEQWDEFVEIYYKKEDRAING